MKITVEYLIKKIAERHNLSRAEAEDALRWTCSTIKYLIDEEGCTSFRLPYLFSIEFKAMLKKSFYNGVKKRYEPGLWVVYPKVKVGPVTRKKLRESILNGLNEENKKDVPSKIFQTENSTN